MQKKTSVAKLIKNRKIAVIDLGSNTFHLLVVEEQKDQPPYFKTIFRKREFVFVLGKDSDQIGQEEQLRAIECISAFDSIIKEYKVGKIIPAATAAFRMAKNGQSFLTKLGHLLNVPISIFSGQEEANYIFKGISLMPRKFNNNNLIMDIGGGSFELILFKNKTVQIAESFKAGISFIRNNFQISEPITVEEKIILFNYLDGIMNPLLREVKSASPIQLLGASGPFEIIEKLTDSVSSIMGNIFVRGDVLAFSEKITSATKLERRLIDRMPANRSDLSKESFLLIEYILLSLPSIQNICVSPFSLKEGIIAEYLN